MATAIRQSEKTYLAVCAEYLDMPGLILTLDQAARLFHMDREECVRTLTELVEAGFLRQVGGRYARADVGFDMEHAGWSDVTGLIETPRPGTRGMASRPAAAPPGVAADCELAGRSV
jgi:hypothetical protein